VILHIVVEVIQLYILVLFVRIMLTWFPTNPWSGMGRFERVLGRFTDPVLAPVRRVLPPLRVGGGAVDLSPLVVLVGLEILVSVLARR
jgi:YggT family protein